MNALNNKNLSTYINISRWMAAFLVVVHHVRDMVLIDYQYTTMTRPFIMKFVYFVTALGHESVVVFFVISGFLVGGLTLQKWRISGVDMSSYAKARFSRIYTALIPALAIGGILDYIGTTWFNASELYTNSSIYHTISLNYQINMNLNFLTLIGNLFMMQSILVSHFGSNGPLWSLSNEWWYYSLFGLISAAVLQNGNKRVFYAALALVLLALLPASLLLWGAIWLLGVLSAVLIGKFNLRIHPFFVFVSFLLILILSRFSHSMAIFNKYPVAAWFARDFVVAVSFAMSLFAVKQIKGDIPFSKLHLKLANFSFSTYLFHFPAMIFFTAFTYQQFGLKFQREPEFESYLHCVSLVVVLYFYCAACYYLTERHTSTIKWQINCWMEKLPKFIG